MKYKLAASTNHLFCPRLKKLVPDTKVPEGVKSIYEIVINGLNENLVKKAMAEEIKGGERARGRQSGRRRERQPAMNGNLKGCQLGDRRQDSHLLRDERGGQGLGRDRGHAASAGRLPRRTHHPLV